MILFSSSVNGVRGFVVATGNSGILLPPLIFPVFTGTTPLIWASRNGHESIVELLLTKGAAADAVGMSNWTALLVATDGKHTKVVQKLLTVVIHRLMWVWFSIR